MTAIAPERMDTAALAEAVYAVEAEIRKEERLARLEAGGFEVIDIADTARPEGHEQLQQTVGQAALWFGFGNFVRTPVPAALAEECGYKPSPTLTALMASEVRLAIAAARTEDDLPPTPPADPGRIRPYSNAMHALGERRFIVAAA